MHKLSKVILILATILLLFTVVVAFRNPFPQFYHNDIIFQQQGLDIIIKDVTVRTITGNSMAPTLPHGSTLFFADASGVLIEPGMIVQFYDNNTNENIIHRVIAVYDTHLVTQGDNNIDPDPDIQRKQIKNIIIGSLFT